MMFGKIWERYFIKQTLMIFFMILFSFYALYFLIDYTSRSSSEHYIQSELNLLSILQFYFYELIEHIDVLIPFALLIATIRTLTQLNMQNELVALLTSGIKMKRLLRPFIPLGLVCVGFIYFNYQYLTPPALKTLRYKNHTFSRNKAKKYNGQTVQSVALKDNSTLIFMDFDPESETFTDAYWIRSFDEIYHMKFLTSKDPTPTGKYIDHFIRNKQGILENVSSEQVKSFPKMRFNRKVLLDTITPPEELSLSKLWHKLPSSTSSEKEAQLTTVFYQKLTMPWLCLIAILGPAPFCVRFSRHFPVFFIYALSIFGLAALYIIIQASVVLGSRQVIAPVWVAIAPMIGILGILVGGKWKRLT